MGRWQCILCSLLFLCLGYADHSQGQIPTIAEIIAGDERFTVLQHMLELTDPVIYGYLSDPRAQLTLFAPDNEALKTVFGETQADQRSYADLYPYRVSEIIRLHIVPAVLDFESVTYPACEMIGTALVNTPLTLKLDDGIINVNQVPLPTEFLTGRNGLVYPIATVLPTLNVIPTAGDHTPDDQKEPKPLDPHYGDLYEDAPLTTDALSNAEIQRVLEDDGRFTLFLRLLDASQHYRTLFEGDGAFTIFIPTDTALRTYFAAEGIGMETLQPNAAEKLIAQRTTPGYITPDYIELSTTWNGPLKFCTLHWLEETMAGGEMYRDMELIVIDFDEATGLIANGGALSETPLYARNTVIYVTEAFRPAPGRG